MDSPTISEKLYVLVFQCDKCGRPMVHTYWTKVCSRADIEGTAFTVSCTEKCKSPETLAGRKARYIFQGSWERENMRSFPLPKWV